jgi:hypothetical protein
VTLSFRRRTLTNPADAAGLLRRLARLHPDSPGRWGRMSARQMVSHLRDAFLMGTDQKPVRQHSRLRDRTIVKWIALYAPFTWPAGIATVPEIDQTIGGTPPGDFDADILDVRALIEIISSQQGFFDGRTHPIFGPLSDAAWMRWGYLHVDHHLRQFGL